MCCGPLASWRAPPPHCSERRHECELFCGSLCLSSQDIWSALSPPDISCRERSLLLVFRGAVEEGEEEGGTSYNLNHVTREEDKVGVGSGGVDRKFYGKSSRNAFPPHRVIALPSHY